MFRILHAAAVCAAVLLAAVPAGATEKLGGHGGGDAKDVPKIGRIELTTRQGGSFRPRGMMVLIEAKIVEVRDTFNVDLQVDWSKGAFYLPTDEPVEVREESKLDLGKIPLLGGLVKQRTVSSEFKGAERVGDAYRMDDLIVVVPVPEIRPEKRMPKINTTVIANRDRSFELGGLLKEADAAPASGVPELSKVPVLRDLFRLGDVHRKKRSLLVLVEPHIVDLQDD